MVDFGVLSFMGRRASPYVILFHAWLSVLVIINDLDLSLLVSLLSSGKGPSAGSE